MLAALGPLAPATDAGRAGRRAPELREAAASFEAYLVGELLRLAQASPLAPGLLDGGSAGRMYRELQLQEIARLAVERGGFGIARQLERGAHADAPGAAGPGGGKSR